MPLETMEGGVSDYKGRNNLIAVKYYLQHGKFPKDCKKDEKRSVRKRSQTFMFLNDILYYTGTKAQRRANSMRDDEEEMEENPDQEPIGAPMLRVCCTTEEERQAAVLRCHIADDGNHFGIEKTTDRVSKDYYWVGIIGTVKKVLHNCEYCVTRGIRCTTGIMSSPMVTFSQTAQEEIPLEYSETGDAESAPGVSVNINTTPSACIKMESLSEIQICPVEIRDEPDIFSFAQETCSHFWQRVEIQVFGPYQTGQKQVFVAVALDCYSQYPEATVIDQISSANLTTFVLNLICRYGVMEKVCIMQNKVTKSIFLHINMKDLDIAGISVIYLTQPANPADERWQRVSKSLDQFVQAHPNAWHRCLEVFMVPLRVSLPPMADYVPSYLTFNRDPVLPEKLSRKSEAMGGSEMRMSEAEERETVDLLVAAYGKEAVMPSPSPTPTPLEIDISILPSVKLEPLTAHEQDMISSSVMPVTFEEIEAAKMEQQQIAAAVEDFQEAYGASTDDEANNLDDGCIEDLDDDDRDEPYRPGASAPRGPSSRMTRSSSRRRVPSLKAKEGLQVKREKRKATPHLPPPVELVPPKRKRGRPPKVRPQPPPPLPPKMEEGEDGDDLASEQTEESFNQQENTSPSHTKPRPALTNSGLFNSMDKLDLDLYYMVIKCYKERNYYPPRVSVDFKRAVRRLAETVVFKDGKLYGHLGKSKGRLILTKERQRFSVLRKAHIKGEEHFGRLRVLKNLLNMNVYWKGMINDLDAYIHSCPECVNNNPWRNKTIIKIPSLSKEVKQREHDGDPHLSEDEEEESSYEDLIQYLTDNTYPATTNAVQQHYIKKRSQFFCIIDGSLYYKSPARPSVKPRQVLFSESTRQAAIAEAHVENGHHISPQDTQLKMRRRYFWAGMTYDILHHALTCCMKDVVEAIPVEHRSPVIQKRVNRFRRFYKDGIPDIISDVKLGGPTPGVVTEKQATVNSEQPAAAAAAAATTAAATTAAAAAATATTTAAAAAAEGGTENGSAVSEVAVSQTQDAGKPSKSSIPLTSADIKRAKENQVLRSAIEAVIVRLGGQKTQPPKPRLPKPKKVPLAASNKELTVTQLRVLKGKNKHKCEHCGRIVKGDVAFKIHLYKHTGVKPFSCNVCGKSFSNRKSQRIHMRKHTGIKPYLCSVCGKSFSTSKSQRIHMCKHTGIKPYLCSVCGKSFSTCKSQRMHMRKHTGIKPYLCNQCGREFIRSASLRYHLKAHTTGKAAPVPCDVCHRTFSTDHRLARHKEFKHPAEAKVFICNQCGKNFTAARSLKRHEQTHTGNRRYKCQYCQKSFYRKEYLNSHLANHPEHDPELDKLKPRKKPAKKTTQLRPEGMEMTVIMPGPSGDGVPSNIIHWTESESRRMEETTTVTDMDTYQRQTVTAHPTLSSHVVSSHITHLPPNSITAHSHPIHHSLHHPLAHTARLMNVGGPHGPLSLTVSSARQPLEVMHTGSGQEILLQHDAVPVQYEVECLSAEGQTLTDVDLNAIHMLAQASISGANLHSM